MTEVALAPDAQPAMALSLGLQIRLGWRNLWRNKRRTWLTASGIAFAILLVNFSSAMQTGSYEQMQQLATDMFTGHVQINTQEYIDDSTFGATIANAEETAASLAKLAGVRAVFPRVETFALVSVNERSFGAQILGIDVAAEARSMKYLANLSTGHLPQAAGEVAIGHILARNLRASVGDELVILGTGKEGGVAALVLNIVGLLRSGMSELDRNLVIAPLADVQAGFDLDDEVHSLVLRGDSPELGQQLATGATELLPAKDAALTVRSWELLLPEVQQGIDIDKVGGNLMYWIVLALVAFSVVNSFVMTIFERTREFGMLRALGMRAGQLVWLLQWEAFFIWLLGTVLGIGCAALLVGWLGSTGIDLGEMADSYTAEMFMPTKLYPAWSMKALLMAPVALFFGCQLASLIPGLRLFRLQPVEALRHE